MFDVVIIISVPSHWVKRNWINAATERCKRVPKRLNRLPISRAILCQKPVIADCAAARHATRALLGFAMQWHWPVITGRRARSTCESRRGDVARSGVRHARRF